MRFIAKSAIALSAAMLLFTGCATTELQTNVKMTQSIFVDPVAKDKKLIFIAMRNTSGQNVNIENRIISLLQNKGYKIVDNPDKATYILMANVLYCDKKQENNAAGAMGAGAVAGGAISGYNSGHGSVGGTLVGAGVGGLIGAAIGKLTEDTIYQMQVDIMVKQKAKGKVMSSTGNISGQASVRDGSRAGFLNQFGGNVANVNGGANVRDNRTNHAAQTYESDYIEKQTLLFAEATKMGLTLQEAIPTLETQMANQIAGIF